MSESPPVWPTVRLEELCAKPQYGYTASASASAQGPKYVRIMDIVPPITDWETVPYCEMAESDIDKYRVREGDILVARTGQGSVGTGRFLRSVPYEAVFASYLVRFRVNPPNIPAFFGYLVESREYEQFVRANAGGTSRPSASAPVLGAFPVPLPPIESQHKIAAVLSAYDDLIANNTRRIAILEDMARTVYREWFVEFRYPGSEGVSLVGSELGPIPEGWEIARLDEVASYVSRGVSPKYDDDSAELVINQRCIRDQRVSLGPARNHATLVKPEKYVQVGDVLVNSTGVGTLGRVARVRRPCPRCTVDSHVTIIRASDRVDNSFFGHALLDRESEFERLGHGATGQTELRKAAIQALVMRVPPVELQRLFGDSVEALHALSENLLASSRNLTATRSLLLPRLVSGDVDVSDLDIDMGVAS